MGCDAVHNVAVTQEPLYIAIEIQTPRITFWNASWRKGEKVEDLKHLSAGQCEACILLVRALSYVFVLSLAWLEAADRRALPL